MTDTSKEAVERCAECDCEKGGIFCTWFAQPDPQVRQLIADYAALATKCEELEKTLALADDQRREWERHCKTAEAERDALKAKLATARREALEEAADICEQIRHRQIMGPMPERACFDQEQAIRALIDKSA